jgi:hypothetical protein
VDPDPDPQHCLFDNFFSITGTTKYPGRNRIRIRNYWASWIRFRNSVVQISGSGFVRRIRHTASISKTNNARITAILSPGSLVLGLVHVGSNSIADSDGEGGDLNQALHLPLLCLLVNLCQPAFLIFITMKLLYKSVL